jgi:hypothetical protein
VPYTRESLHFARLHPCLPAQGNSPGGRPDELALPPTMAHRRPGVVVASPQAQRPARAGILAYLLAAMHAGRRQGRPHHPAVIPHQLACRPDMTCQLGYRRRQPELGWAWGRDLDRSRAYRGSQAVTRPSRRLESRPVPQLPCHRGRRGGRGSGQRADQQDEDPSAPRRTCTFTVAFAGVAAVRYRTIPTGR